MGHFIQGKVEKIYSSPVPMSTEHKNSRISVGKFKRHYSSFCEFLPTVFENLFR
jgi:hypothetical protein